MISQPSNWEEQAAVGFPKFRKLPPEVRLLIWDHVAIAPRVVRVSKDYHPEDTTDEQGVQLKTSYSIPPILRTSQESRRQGQKQFELIYNNQADINPFYFRFALDTLFVQDDIALDILMSGSCIAREKDSLGLEDLLQFLMLGGELGQLNDSAMELLCKFKSLKTLQLAKQSASIDSGNSADLGPFWANKIMRKLRGEHKSAVIGWALEWEMIQDFKKNKVCLLSYFCLTNFRTDVH